MVMQAQMNCLILFEDEIRLAAKLVRKFATLPRDTPQAEFQAACEDAIQAVYVALEGAHDDSRILLLSRKPTKGAENDN